MTLRTRIIVTMVVAAAGTAFIVLAGSFILRRSTPAVTPSPISVLPSTRTLVVSPTTTLTPPIVGTTPGQNVPPAVNPPAPSAIIPPLAPSAPLSTEAQLGSVAFSFAETYGSFSNQGGSENLERLRFLMTRALNQWTDTFIAQHKTNDSTGNTLYYGITTRALSSRVTAQDGTHLQFVVQTERTEVRGIAGNATRSLQDLTIDFIREDGVWKVNTLTWGIAKLLKVSPGASSGGAGLP